MAALKDPRFESPDGREVVTVSNDGNTARFTVWRWSDQTLGHPYPDAGWHPATLSGIYLTPSEALAAAAEEHPWLSTVLSAAESTVR